MGRSRRWRTGLVVAALGMASCTVLLSERFAVRGPVTNSLFGWGVGAPAPDVFARRVKAPEGFGVSIFAEGIANARILRFTPAGDLLVSTPRKGAIVLVSPDRDGDGRADGQRLLVEGLRAPHGIDLYDRWLYIAEEDAVARVGFDARTGTVEGHPERVVTGLPTGGNHWTRTLRFGPDGWLYVTVGSSCNACIERDGRRAAMLRFRPDGSKGEVFATGLRNSVDFDWHPRSGALYATDNGRDLLGDDFPPCELNRIERGGSYGWPFANGSRIPDPDHGAGRESEIAGSIPPVHGFGPHTAPLGISFLRDPRWKDDYRGAAVVALHGSWNRTTLSGYRVVSLHWKSDGSIEERDLLWGLEKDGDVIGRPVGVAEGPDGAIYVSDDYAGVVYRIAAGEASRTLRGPIATADRTSIPLDSEAVGRGRALWGELGCAQCHEAAAAPEGQVVKELSGLALRYTAAGLAEYLETPNPPMPKVALESDGLRDLAAYLLAAHP